MSTFTSELIVTPLPGGRRWKLKTPFIYEVGHKGSNDPIIVPKGFITDWASIPRVFWRILPLWDRHLKAALVHDYLYQKQTRSRKEADKIFLEAMKVLEVPWWKRQAMYWGVRIGGWVAWKKHKREKNK